MGLWKKPNKNTKVRSSLLIAIIIVLNSMFLENTDKKTNEQVIDVVETIEGLDEKTDELLIDVVECTEVTNSDIVEDMELSNDKELNKYEEEIILNEIKTENMEYYLNLLDNAIINEDTETYLSLDENSYTMAFLDKGTVVERLWTYNGWDLIRYNNRLSFVPSNYTSDYVDTFDVYYYIEKEEDIARTIEEINLYAGPNDDEECICKLDCNEELIIIGIAYTINNDSWYLVKGSGQIGYVKTTDVESLKDIIYSFDPTIANIKVKKMGYIKYDSILCDNPYGNEIDYVEKWQSFQLLEEYGDYYLINVDGKVGYINKDCTNLLNGNYLIVDIDTQRLYLYCDTDVVFKTKCTTGKRTTPTTKGYFDNALWFGDYCKFDSKHSADILWFNFNDGEGIHDASWEALECFGDIDYYLEYGSNGCVRVPDSSALFLHENIDIKTPVLVKK